VSKYDSDGDGDGVEFRFTNERTPRAIER